MCWRRTARNRCFRRTECPGSVYQNKQYFRSMSTVKFSECQSYRACHRSHYCLRQLFWFSSQSVSSNASFHICAIALLLLFSIVPNTTAIKYHAHIAHIPWSWNNCEFLMSIVSLIFFSSSFFRCHTRQSNYCESEMFLIFQHFLPMRLSLVPAAHNSFFLIYFSHELKKKNKSQLSPL